jgi:type I restriction enzyme S subunit
MTVRLDAVCEITMGQAPPGDSYNEIGEGLPLLAGAGDFRGSNPSAKKFTRQITKRCASGDIILGIRASIGDKVVADREYCLGRGVAGLRPRNGELDQRYLWHWLTSIRATLEGKAKGATFRQVNRNDVGELSLSLPSIDEQRRIAAILDQAEELRAKRRAAIALLDQLPQAIFLEMFGDLRTNSKGWRVPALADFATVQIGPFGSLLHQHDYVEGGVPIVNPKHIQGGRIETATHETISEAKFKKLSTYKLEANDIVMGRRGEMGRCAVVSGNALPLLCGTGSLLIRPDSTQATSLYLQIMLSGETVKKRLEHASIGQTLPNLNSGIVERLEIPLPPLDIQRQFAARVEAIHRAKAAHQSALAELDALFAALQSRAFEPSPAVAQVASSR